MKKKVSDNTDSFHEIHRERNVDNDLLLRSTVTKEDS